MKIFGLLLQYLISIYNYIELLYIHYFKITVSLFELLILQIAGETVLDLVKDHLNRVACFYMDLWFIIKRRIYDKFDTILLTAIWKIKRSDNYILKIIGKYLSKYHWFNNNIIKF